MLCLAGLAPVAKEDQATGETEAALASTYYFQGRYDESIRIFESVVARMRELFGDDPARAIASTLRSRPPSAVMCVPRSSKPSSVTAWGSPPLSSRQMSQLPLR